MFAFIKTRATRFNIFSSRFAANFLDFWLFCWIVRFWQQVFFGCPGSRPDPIPTRLTPTGPRSRIPNNCYQFFIPQVWPPWVKSEQLFGFYSAQRILLLDPEQKKLQQVLESLCELLVDLFVI